MKISLDNVNYKISLPIYETENIEEEVILYLVEQEKIAVLNPTSAIIWNIIKTSYENGHNILSYQEIYNKFIMFVDVSDEDINKVNLEICNEIKKFIDEQLLIICE